MEALHLGEGGEPGGDLGVALFLGGPHELGVHVRVLVGLAGHSGLEVGQGVTQGQTRSRIGGLGRQVHQVLEGVTGLTVCAVLEEGGHLG